MGRSRRRRRRRKTGRHGGFGSPGGNPNKKKKKKVNRARQKLNKRIKSKTLKSKVKSIKKAVAKNKTETKKKTISASQSRKQVRQNTKQKIATRKKINTPSLGRIGRTLRNIRQPISGLSSMAINSVLGRPGIASTIAQAAVNNLGAQNARTRDMSKLSPQQQRKYQRLSEKTGKDYSIRNPAFRLNMNMRDIARFAGLDQNRFYNRLPKSIREAQVNKQFYGNPTKKGWHSSQRTGRGQGLRTADFQDSDRNGIDDRDQYTTGQPRQIPPDFGREVRGIPRERMGPQQDWLSQLYSSHNISGGKLDQGARDYWTNEAKTKGRDSVMQSIIGTAKAQGTYGGRKKPQRISTGSRRKGGGGPIAAAISAGMGLYGSGLRARKAKQKHDLQNRYAQRSYDLQAKGMKRRQGMLAKTIAATMAARGM